MEAGDHVSDVLKSMFHIYEEIYYIQLEENYYQMIYPDQNGDMERRDYQKAVECLLRERVEPEDVKNVQRFLSADCIRQGLADKDFLETRYRRLNGSGKYEWCVISLTTGERRDGQVVTATMSIRSVGELVKGVEQEQTFLKNQICAEKAANQAKSEYLSMMFHDIRTPINIIMGMSYLVRKYQDDRERLDYYLKKIEASGKYLRSLLDDGLDISQIESGRLALVMKKFSLEDMILEIVEMEQGMLEGRKQSLSFEFVNLVHGDVVGDAKRLAQILVNIISNSIKYSGDGTSIVLEVEEVANMDFGRGMYRFTVRDNGVGMEQEFLKRIFAPYSRQIRQDMEIAGNGLGMYIAKQLVTLMEGQIQVSSEIHKGTEFVIEIPLWQQGQQEMLEACVTVEDMHQKNVEFEGIYAILAEDNECNAEISAEMLRTLGASVVWAKDGKEAVEIFEQSQEKTFDCVFMDVNMPVMDGVSATKKIREMNRKDAKLPVFAMTASVFPDDIKRFRKAGMQNHIGKPGTIEDFREILAEWFPQKIKKCE